MENLLAVVDPKDLNDPLYLEFGATIPTEKNIIFNGLGFIGGLEETLQVSSDEKKKKFMIFQIENSYILDTTYFVQSPNSALVPIADQLIVKLRYSLKPSEQVRDGVYVRSSTCPIEDALHKYNLFACADPCFLLKKDLRDHADKFRNLVLQEGDLLVFQPIYVSMGLETADERYLLCQPQLKGPYSWKL